MPKHKSHPKPSIGSKFTKLYKGKSYTLEVIKSASGVAYRTKGIDFLSPTAAAKSLTNNEVNGWRFWRIN